MPHFANANRPVFFLLPLMIAVSLSLTLPAHSEPTVIVNNPTPTEDSTSTPNPSQANSEDDNVDNTVINSNTAINPNEDVATQLAQNNPNSVAVDMLPTTQALSTANQKLLTENARLQREVNDLDTQVNVLVNERSGQLFLYGAMTGLGAVLLGLLIGWLTFGRKGGW